MSAEDQIRQFAERIVRLEEERKALANDIKDVKAEAKAAGFSPKLIATCVRIMLLEAEKRAEALAGHEELDLYLGAVGLIARRDHDEIAAPQERLAGHPAAERSPASNPGVHHVDRGASAQPCSVSLPTEAQAGRRWGEVAFWEAQSATGRMPSGADTGSDVGTVAQVSRDGASESGSRTHCRQPQPKQPTGGDSSERRHLSHQTRPTEAGSSAGKPTALCQAEAGDCREIGASASATQVSRVGAFGMVGGFPVPATPSSRGGTGSERGDCPSVTARRDGTYSHVGAIL